MASYKKTLISAGLALIAIPLAGQAAPISINVGGGVNNVTQLDWSASPVISIGGNTAFAAAARLAGGTCADDTVGLPVRCLRPRHSE